jgi:hypothetical protein
VRSLHVGFSRIFPALGLETVEDWNADRHLPRYLKAEVVPKESQYTSRMQLSRSTRFAADGGLPTVAVRVPAFQLKQPPTNPPSSPIWSRNARS